MILKDERQYFVILADCQLIFVEITEEMRRDIKEKYGDDEYDYVDMVLSEEYNFSLNDVYWGTVKESEMEVWGRKPRLEN